MFFEANIGLCANHDIMAIYKGCFIDMHFLGNAIRGTIMSKLVVPTITLSQEKAVYTRTSKLILNRSGTWWNCLEPKAIV
jgi:hypothetical protein